jgi:hypothetical protein
VPSNELVGRRFAAARPDPDATATLRDAFGAVPEQQRLVLFLRHVPGLLADEIPYEMGRTPASVNGVQHRGRGTPKAALRRADMTAATARVCEAARGAATRPPTEKGARHRSEACGWRS